MFNGGAIARGAVLTWHLNDFVGRGWVGWWLIQGMWVGAATTDTRVVVGGLVVLSDFVPKRFFLRVPERILRVPKQLPDPLIQGAAHLNAKNDFLKTLHQEMYQKNMMNILVILHAHMSYALMCSMVVHLLLVQYWLDTLMTLLGGGGWGGDWYKGGGGWVGGVKRFFKRCFLRVP